MMINHWVFLRIRGVLTKIKENIRLDNNNDNQATTQTLDALYPGVDQHYPTIQPTTDSSSIMTPIITHQNTTTSQTIPCEIPTDIPISAYLSPPIPHRPISSLSCALSPSALHYINKTHQLDFNVHPCPDICPVPNMSQIHARIIQPF